jgi:hypothetical protein
MSDYDYVSDDTPIRCIDIDDPVNLPANAPTGCPHIIDLQRVADYIDDFGSHRIGLHAVDTIATVLYKWNPAGLVDLLDMTKDSFHWKYYNFSNYEIYVVRSGKNVKVSRESAGAQTKTADLRAGWKPGPFHTLSRL